jgi:hypothetical protein
MPYYVYKIFETPIRRLKKIEQHEIFREASSRAKQLRSELAGDEPCIIKVIFAESELHAEDMLNQIREAVPNPQDD